MTATIQQLRSDLAAMTADNERLRKENYDLWDITNGQLAEIEDWVTKCDTLMGEESDAIKELNSQLAAMTEERDTWKASSETQCEQREKFRSQKGNLARLDELNLAIAFSMEGTGYYRIYRQTHFLSMQKIYVRRPKG
jgi:uncharacterized membrane protein YqiK